MSDGLFGNNGAQFGLLHSSEGPARAGKDYLIDLRGAVGRREHTLENRAVLAVYRENLDVVFLRKRHNVLAAGDKAFFIGERKALSRLDCRDGGFQTRKTDDGVYDGVRAAFTYAGANRVLAGVNFCSRIGYAYLKLLRGGGVRHNRGGGLQQG